MSIAKHRLQNQRLVGARFSTPEAVVRWLGAVQAQDYHSAKWALALRSHRTTEAGVEKAFNAGAILRLHAMRPTWHFVAPADLRWMLALTSPRVHVANAHMYRKLELDEALFHRVAGIFTSALQGGRTLTRKELADSLEREGIPARGQRLAYVVMQAELSGLLCSGPLHGKQHTYALVDERIPVAPPLSRDEALAALAHRYFTSHGPASVRDFAWWSGLTIADAKLGVELVRPDLQRAIIDGNTYWTGTCTGSAETADPIVHLLPNYDEHVVAYKDHSHTIDPAARDALRIRTDRPLDVHLVMRNGLIVGGWRRTLEKRRCVVKVDMLIEPRPDEQAALGQAAADYATFLGLPVELALSERQNLQ